MPFLRHYHAPVRVGFPCHDPLAPQRYCYVDHHSTDLRCSNHDDYVRDHRTGSMPVDPSPAGDAAAAVHPSGAICYSKPPTNPNRVPFHLHDHATIRGEVRCCRSSVAAGFHGHVHGHDLALVRDRDPDRAARVARAPYLYPRSDQALHPGVIHREETDGGYRYHHREHCLVLLDVRAIVTAFWVIVIDCVTANGTDFLIAILTDHRHVHGLDHRHDRGHVRSTVDHGPYYHVRHHHTYHRRVSHYHRDGGVPHRILGPRTNSDLRRPPNRTNPCSSDSDASFGYCFPFSESRNHPSCGRAAATTTDCSRTGF